MQTRRDFLKGAMTIGAGLGLSGVLGPLSAAPASAMTTSTIDWWDPNDLPSFQVYVTPLLDTFRKQTGISVNNENISWGVLVPRLTAAGASHTTPAVSLGGAGFPAIFAKQALLSDVSGVIKTVDGVGGRIPSPMVVACGYNGVPYGVPLFTAANGYFYRKDMFAKAGITDVPNPATGGKYAYTWDEFVQVCKALNHPPNQYALVWEVAGITAQPNIWSTLVTNGAYILNQQNKLDWDTPETIEAYEYMALLLTNYAPPGAASYDATTATNAFLAGKTAMFANGGEVLSTILSSDVSWKDEVGFMPYPVSKNRSSYAGTVSYMLFKGSQLPQATEFVEFMLRPDNLIKSIWPYRTIVTPSVPGALTDPALVNDPTYKRFKPLLDTKAVVAGNASEMAAYFKVTPLSGTIEASGIGSEVLQSILVNHVSAAAAVKSATSKLQQIISGASQS